MITHRKGQRLGEIVPLAPIKRRGKQGRARMAEIKADPAAQTESLKARARILGKTATRAALADLRAPWWGCNAGRAMAEVAPEADRPDLWDAIQHMRRVVAAYDREIGAPGRHAKCLRLLAPTDAMEADASSPAQDDRSDEDRMRAAARAYNLLMGWVAPIDRITRRRALAVFLDDDLCFDAAGLVMVLQAVSDGIKGRN